MAYKPKNVASYRDDSSSYPKGSATGKGGGVVPGTTGSQDRGSQPVGAEFYSDGQVARPNPDFALGDGGMNDRLDPRKNENFGKASYGYEKPTL